MVATPPLPAAAVAAAAAAALAARHSATGGMVPTAAMYASAEEEAILALFVATSACWRNHPAWWRNAACARSDEGPFHTTAMVSVEPSEVPAAVCSAPAMAV